MTYVAVCKYQYRHRDGEEYKPAYMTEAFDEEHLALNQVFSWSQQGDTDYFHNATYNVSKVEEFFNIEAKVTLKPIVPIEPTGVTV